jgi:endonuclease G
MKKLVLALFLLFSISVLANPIDDKCPQVVIWGAPQIAKEGDNQYICKSDYALNLNYKTKVAYFVVEHITNDEISSKSASRKDDFREDPEVPTQYRVTLNDYKGSNLDRGHMAPAADFVSDAKLMSESFFLSNMMPQNQGNNRGIWKSTEEQVRVWAAKADIYAITGTHFDEGYKIMGNNVGIPTHVYKIVIQPANNRMIAFWYPNEKLDPKQIAKYVVSVSDIESKTGIDFSPSIPEDLKPLETVIANYEDWNK